MDLTFDEWEENLQKKYDDIEMNYAPCTVLSVKLLEFRNISAGFLDHFENPDPQFEVSCLKIQDPRLNSFRTTIPKHMTEREINEEFCFVIPDSINPDENFPIKIVLRHWGSIEKIMLGEVTLDASQVATGGDPIKQTLRFGEEKKAGELDVMLFKTKRTTPDIRYSLGLCPEEREFRKKRTLVTCKAMQKLLGEEKRPRDQLETPIVSLAASGGGYRSVTAQCGALEALHDAGIVDTLTYTSALSGGAWYFCAAHAAGAVSSGKFKEFHDGLRDRMHHSIWEDFFSPLTYHSYSVMVDDFFKKFDLPRTFVNYFPGYLVSKQLFGKDQLNMKLSDLARATNEAEVPYLLVSAIQVRNKVPAFKYFAYAERSPHEIYLPSYGIGLKPEDEGARWNNGIRLRSCPEYPLHFTIGMTGCAFSILLKDYIKYGTEEGHLSFDELDSARVDHNKTENNLPSEENSSEDESESDEEEYDDDSLSMDESESDEEEYDDDSLSMDESQRQHFTNMAIGNGDSTATSPVASFINELSHIGHLIRKSSLFSTRNFLFGRTARTHNFAHNNCNWKRYHLNPLMKSLNLNDEQKLLVELAGHKALTSSTFMPKRNNSLSFVDAGLLKNVPTDALLRPQRSTDLMIVIDANEYKDDDKFDYQPMFVAAAHAAQAGLKFPDVKCQELNEEPKELIILPSNGEGCPTVLWFTLCNKKFKKLQNYVPKAKIQPPSESRNRKFNDFEVYSKGNHYSTFNFHYKPYHFEQLRELMYHNVSTHIEIKEALAGAIARKRTTLNRQ